MAIPKLHVLGLSLLLVLTATVLADELGQSPTNAGGETLYNGIVLPPVWPPKLDKLDLPRDPVTPYYIKNPPAVIPIDIGRQLFVDDFLIEETNLSRQMHRGDIYPNPVHQPLSYSGGLWYDPAEQMYKLWYGGHGLNMATSKDGIHWEHPKLDVVPGTNTVMPSSNHSTSVWLNHDATDPNKKYVLIYTITFEPSGYCRYWVRFSPDGVHWSEKIATNSDAGDRSTGIYNPFRKVWVFDVRQGWGFPLRPPVLGSEGSGGWTLL